MRADKTRFPIRCAGMDVGSNALRLAIAEFKSPTHYRILERKRVPVRLGQSVFKTSRIDPDTLDKALAAVMTATYWATALWYMTKEDRPTSGLLTVVGGLQAWSAFLAPK